MHPFIGTLILFLWLVLIAVWFFTAWRVKRPKRRESIRSRFSHLFPLALTAVLLACHPAAIDHLDRHLYNDAVWNNGIGLICTMIGTGFALWARLRLGRNWSGIVTIKEDHALVTTGPYAITRHPIYTGLLLAVLGTAIYDGAAQDFLAFVILALSFWHKLRLEERWMIETFGEDYADYKNRVAALIPSIF